MESTNILVMLNLPWPGFGKKTFTKIEAYVGMAERLVRDLEIKEALPTKKGNNITQQSVICRLV